MCVWWSVRGLDAYDRDVFQSRLPVECPLAVKTGIFLNPPDKPCRKFGIPWFITLLAPKLDCETCNGTFLQICVHRRSK